MRWRLLATVVAPRTGKIIKHIFYKMIFYTSHLDKANHQESRREVRIYAGEKQLFGRGLTLKGLNSFMIVTCQVYYYNSVITPVRVFVTPWQNTKNIEILSGNYAGNLIIKFSRYLIEVRSALFY